MIHLHLYIQGDKNQLTKRNKKKMLQSKQIVCTQRFLTQYLKLQGDREIFMNDNVEKLLILY